MRVSRPDKQYLHTNMIFGRLLGNSSDLPNFGEINDQKNCVFAYPDTHFHGLQPITTSNADNEFSWRIERDGIPDIKTAGI